MHDKRRKLIKLSFLTALFVWSALAYIELGKFMYSGILFARNIDNRPYISDFANHYNAGLLAAKCLQEKIDIYNIDVQNESLKKLVAPIVPEQPFYLQYPPYFFLMAMPMAFMPMSLAWMLWNILGIGLSVWSLLVLAKLIQLDPPPVSSKNNNQNETSFPEAQSFLKNNKGAILFTAFIFSSYPAWLSAEIGQTSLYLLPAAALLVILLKKERYILSGIAGGLLMIKLQYAPIFFVAGLIAGRFRFLLGWIICMSTLLLSSVAVLGPENVMHYPQALLSGETGRAVSGVSSFMMQNLRGELTLSFSDEDLLRRIVITFFGLGTLLCSLLTWNNCRDIKSKNFDIAFAIILMIALVCSPHTHVQDYLLLGLSALLLWKYVQDPLSNNTAIVRNMLIAFAPISWLFFYTQPLFFIVRIQLFFFYLVILGVFAYFELRRTKPPQS